MTARAARTSTRAPACAGSRTGSPPSAARCGSRSRPGAGRPSPWSCRANRHSRGRRALPRRALTRVLEEAVSRSSPPSADAEALWAAVAATRRTSPSSTSGCHRPSPTRACVLPSGSSHPATGRRVLVLDPDSRRKPCHATARRRGAWRRLPAQGSRRRCRRAGRRGPAGGAGRDRHRSDRRRRRSSARSRSRDRLDPLTPREREVLSLMAEGRSNVGIADRLFVTEKTVETHVASILGKLGLESQTGRSSPGARRPARTCGRPDAAFRAHVTRGCASPPRPS